MSVVFVWWKICLSLWRKKKYIERKGNAQIFARLFKSSRSEISLSLLSVCLFCLFRSIVRFLSASFLLLLFVLLLNYSNNDTQLARSKSNLLCVKLNFTYTIMKCDYNRIFLRIIIRLSSRNFNDIYL